MGIRPKRVYNTSIAVSQRVARAIKLMAKCGNKSQKEVAERILWRAYLRVRRRLTETKPEGTSIIR